jgi:hypothetical protein
MKLLDKSLTERTASADQLLRDLGYRGDSTKVTAAPARSTVGKRQEPLQRRLARSVRRRGWLVAACVLLYILPGGLVAGSLMLGGFALFFAGQSVDRMRTHRKLRSYGLTAAAMIVLGLAQVWALTLAFGLTWDLNVFHLIDSPQSRARATQTVSPPLPRSSTPLNRRPPPTAASPWAAFLSATGIVRIAMSIVLPLVGCAAYAGWRRARREQALWEVALRHDAGDDRFLEVMRGMVDTRTEDVGFHLRYAELLFARGDYAAAAVEAQLVLDQDQYHFNGNLLLANAYASLGLWEDCLTVCHDYLQVTKYSFEFRELRQQCFRRLCDA